MALPQRLTGSVAIPKELRLGLDEDAVDRSSAWCRLPRPCWTASILRRVILRLRWRGGSVGVASRQGHRVLAA